MALNPSMRWMVRKSGLETNGGGFDPLVSGAGTDYSDQNSPQLSITDLTSTASTTVSSVTGGFTAAMIGNVIRLASAAGSPVADSGGSRYLVITAYTNTNTVTVDKTSGTYTAGVAKVGGAHATIASYASSTSGITAPTLSTPLAAGHTVYMRSAGSSADPAIGGTADYDYSAGYMTFPNGSASVGLITFVGLGASESLPVGGADPLYRPLIKTGGLMYYAGTYWAISNQKVFWASGAGLPQYGLTYQSSNIKVHRCILDMNGNDAVGIDLGNYSASINNDVVNTGSTTTGSNYAAVNAHGVLCNVLNTKVSNVRWIGIYVGNSSGLIEGNIVANCKSDGFKFIAGGSGQISIKNNTAYNCSGHAFTFHVDALSSYFANNTASKIPSGKYGINVESGTAAVNDRIKMYFDYNNVYLDGGAGGLYNAISAGPHDTNLDPQFTDASNLDFSIGTNLKAKGIGVTPFTGSVPNSYVDIGAVQRQEAGGSAGMLFIPNLEGV